MARSATASTAALLAAMVVCFFVSVVVSEDLYYHWDVTYGIIAPMGVKQQGILINGEFPGPKISCTTGDNLIIDVFNKLTEPLLFTWNGIHQTGNSWQDGMPGTNCPIMPGKNYTYRFQVDDQMGSFSYYPSIGLQKAAGGFGGLQINSRPNAPVPYKTPADDYTVIVNDWYTKNHGVLEKTLDNGGELGHPNGVLINGKARAFPANLSAEPPLFVMELGKTYKYRICNVGLKTTLSFRFQSHVMKLVEMDGTHMLQNQYLYLDVPVGRCFAVLVEANQEPGDYYMVASARFNSVRLFESDIMTTAVIRYIGSNRPPVPFLPPVPSGGFWSSTQLLSFKQNRTVNGADAKPQGAYHYGEGSFRKLILSSNKAVVNGKVRYGFNGVSHIDTATPLKLAEYFQSTEGVFKYDIMSRRPVAGSGNNTVVAPNVFTASYLANYEIVFENLEDKPQTFHLDGHTFFPVSMGNGTWSELARFGYDTLNAAGTHTVQVYPKSWAVVLVKFNNPGMWNLRSEDSERRYLGQQLYISVKQSAFDFGSRIEKTIPDNVLLCGSVASKGRQHPRKELATKQRRQHTAAQVPAATPTEAPAQSPKAAVQQQPPRAGSVPKPARNNNGEGGNNGHNASSGTGISALSIVLIIFFMHFTTVNFACP